MQCQHNSVRLYPALTLLEMVIAIAIMVVIFAAILPLFASIRNSWDSKQAGAELLQNSRVLIDHLNRNLSKAVKITDVSSSSETDGYIQFENNDGNDLRYEIGADNYVEFGLVGSLSDLAGPVSQLQFTCYDACDLDTPLDTPIDVNSIRFMEVETTLTNSATLGRDKTFTTSVYFRTNGNPGRLVGWWRLDETSGTTAADSSGNGNDGTLVNMNPATDWVTGQIGGALDFDGNNDYVNCGNNTSLQITADMTITAWAQLAAGSAGNYYGIAGKLRDAPGYAGFALVRHDSNYFRFWTADGTSIDSIASNVAYTDTNWHHIAGVRRSGTTYLYIDGIEQTDTNTRAISDSGDYAFIGRQYSNYDSRYFDGIIDDVRIYNRALSDEEIAQLANALGYEEFSKAKVSSDITSITIQTPDTNEGDLLIAAVATDEDTSASIEPPGGEGWTEVDVGNFNGEVTLGAWWKLADASESSSHQFTWSGGQQAYGWIMRFTGHDDSDPIHDFSASGESSSTPTSPAVATTVDNCLILRLGAFDDDDITVGDPGLSGHTAITMDESASGSVGLVGWWKLDETSGTTAADSSGNDNDGTLVNGPSWTTGQIDGALQFDGYNDYVSLPIGSVINSLTNCTIATWVDWDGGGSWQRIWDFGTGTTVNMFLTTRNSYTGTPRFAITTSGWSGEEQTTAPDALSSGWHHLTVTIDADNHTHKLYLDGSPVAQNTSGYLEPDDLGYTNRNRLGRSQYSADPYFDGRLDDVRIYDFALSTEEVAELAQWSGGSSGMVSGGAGYVKQADSGGSGTSNFSLTASNDAQMLTIAIAPDPDSGGGGDYGIRP